MKAHTHYYRGAHTPQEAEARFQRVTIQLDCRGVVDGLRGICNIVIEFDSIIHVCTSLLSHVRNLKVSFIWRQANLLAHTLARASRSYASSHGFALSSTCNKNLTINEMS